MPEGDTVWRAARAARRRTVRPGLVATDVRVPAFATVDLSGSTVTETVSRGKHLLTRIDGDQGAVTLHTHLKMEGGWRVLRPGQRWPRPAHTARVVLDHRRRRSRSASSSGSSRSCPTDREPDVVGHLGPDLLGPDWDPDEALRRLHEQPGRAVKESLLDQTRLAGIGNMYANELCFVSGVAPADPGRARCPTCAGWCSAPTRCSTSTASAPSSRPPATWRAGDSSGSTTEPGEPCRRCGTRIVRSMLGPEGEERTTFACPRCQP